MPQTHPASASASGTFSYHLLRAASERFQSGARSLPDDQRREAERQARQTQALESLVLSTPEARDIQIPEPRVDEAVGQIRQRYEDDATFLADLAENGLDLPTLRAALRRELVFDAVMQRVGARALPITEVDERLFYELHGERFRVPERRVARHILVTINAAFADSGRDAARARIDQIRAALYECPQDFGALAQRHSECPTAMEQGRLGTLARGRLYPELDQVLVALEAGEISAVVESEIGFHILLCEGVEHATTIAFEQASGKIRTLLQERRRRDCQKTWIATLKQAAPSSNQGAPA